MKSRFLLAVLFVSLIGSAVFFYGTEPKPEEPQDSSNGQKLFTKKDKLSISSGEFLEVSDRIGLNPQADRDFYILTWFNTRKFPPADQRMTLFKKLNDSDKPAGYAFGFSRYDDDLYPQVYWRDQKKGRWFSFSKFYPKPRKWYGFLVSYTDNTYLAVHLLKANTDSIEVKNLGGQIVKGVTPQVTNDLLVGSLQNKFFQGNLAKLAVFSPDREKYPLAKVLKVLSRSSDMALSDLEELNPAYYLDSTKQASLALKKH